MNIDEISRLAELMSTHDLSEISLHNADMRVRIRRGFAVMAAPAAMVPASAPGVGAAPGPTAGGGAVEAAPPMTAITSPIVGTFYVAAAPDAPPFVKPGDAVEPDTVVCIVEAMKVMNEIKAEMRGVIKRVLADNATPVEFGQPLFEVEVP
ncbi:MAG: acetyl-CoA carboxylase biotin carboxyl carrier protein [Lentisphaeria bacterium]|nr:acetyl-CoA carboxylase biotin carboxyl carrier protein [Lentisphaeria bacterium]